MPSAALGFSAADATGPGEALRRKHPVVAVLHAVDAVPGIVETSGVHVDLAPALITQDEVGAGLAGYELEPVPGQRVAHARHLLDAHDEVEVLVGSRLAAQQGIHAPSAIEPGRHVGAGEAIEQFDDVGFGHHRDDRVWHAVSADATNGLHGPVRSR